jgi:hypothetical protein
MLVTRITLILLHAVIGVSAVGAGQALALKPSGEALTFKTEWLEGSPFSDYRIPGLFLLFVIAPTNLLSALFQLKRWRAAAPFSFGCGAILLVWSTVQWLSIGYRHWSQPVWYVLFAMTTALGAVQVLGPGRRREVVEKAGAMAGTRRGNAVPVEGGP